MKRLEAYNHCATLFISLRSQRRDIINSNDFKWSIGRNAFNQIKDDITELYNEDMKDPTDGKYKLFGIMVDINPSDSDGIYLWENITEKI